MWEISLLLLLLLLFWTEHCNSNFSFFFYSMPFQWYLLISLSSHCSIDPWHRLTTQVGGRMYFISSVVLKSHSKMSLVTPASLLKWWIQAVEDESKLI